MGILCKYSERQEEAGKAACRESNGFLAYFCTEALQDADAGEGSARRPSGAVCVCRRPRTRCDPRKSCLGISSFPMAGHGRRLREPGGLGLATTRRSCCEIWARSGWVPEPSGSWFLHLRSGPADERGLGFVTEDERSFKNSSVHLARLC